jgi:non-specific serine/threonine protein kinase
LGIVAAEQGDARTALDLFRQSTAYLEGIGQSPLRAINSINMGGIARDSGDFVQARALIEDSLALFEALNDQSGVALAYAHLGELATAEADFASARTHLTRSLQMARGTGDATGIALTLIRFAELATARRQPRRALRLAAAAANLRDQVEAALSPSAQAQLDARLEPARRLLGGDAAAAYVEGLALSLEAAIAEALAVDLADSPYSGEATTGRIDPLSTRERDVARLIAGGRSNRQIAQELVIGEATVATHIQHILKKLQLSSRTQVALWAERQETSRGTPHATLPR